MSLPTSSTPPTSESNSSDDLAPGTVLGERYRIDAVLGQGAMGKVYAAEHVLLRKKLAIKILRADRAQTPEVVARFQREAMAAANIEHPNIAGASDFGRLPDGSVYLVLEYVQGKNLRDEIDKGPLGLERSLHIGKQIASALAGAQELQIVHRDLKPENIMLIEKRGDRDFVKVLDFGIARVPMADGANKPLTRVGLVFGTPEYMAPEQALGQRVDGRADLYALGVILFEMIAGVRPYPAGAANLARQISGRPPRISERAPSVSVPAAVEALLERLLAPDAKKRFQTAPEAVEAFARVTVDSRPPAPRQEPTPPTPPVGTPAQVRLPTFLPGDPLPAFDLPADMPGVARPAPPVASGAVVAPDAIASRPPPEAPTLLRAPSVPPSSPQDASKLLIESAPSAGPAPRAPHDGFLAKLGLKSIALYRAACAWIDANRENLPRFVRRRVKRVSAGALLGGVSAALFVLLVLGLLLVRHGRSEPADTQAAARNTEVRAESIAAQSGAPPSVTPEGPDSGALLASAADLGKKRPAEAVALVGRALAADPKLAEDARSAEVLREAIRADAGVHDAAFGLLQGPMGMQGADVVYELSLDSSVSADTRARAEAWLRTKEFERVSSPALNSAVKLRHAASCEQKHHLLKLAGNVGGKHTLEYLRELQKRTRCATPTETDCYPCLGRDGRLKETIERLERRAND